MEDKEKTKKLEVVSNVEVVKNKSLVTMHNKLVEAKYKLTKEEFSIVLFLIALIQPQDEDLKEYQIPVKILKAISGTKHKNMYRVVKEALEGLLKKPIKIKTLEEDGKERFLICNFISHGEYKEGEGSFIVGIDKKLKPYLLFLKENFTSSKLKYFFSLRSFYSMRLYILLKQFEKTGFRVDYIPELREILGIGKNEYPRFDNFEKRVIKKAVEEINQKTDLEVSYKKKKTGRRITHIEFYIKVKPDAAKERELEKKIIEEVRKLNQGDTTETTKVPSQTINNKEQKQEKIKNSAKEKDLEKVWTEIGKIRKKYEKVLNEILQKISRLNENQILFLLANLNENDIPIEIAKEIVITADRNKALKNPMGFLIKTFDIDMSKARFKELTLTSKKIDEKLLKEKLEKMMIDGTSALDYIRVYWNEVIKPRYNNGELDKRTLKLLREPLQKAVIDDLENKIYVIVPDIAYRDWLDSEFGDDMRKFFKERFDIDDVVVESL
ncbi:replication initiation protein [Hydrogenothermus marinus]|uniref:Plasmid replication initiation protein n=1 Tax=Hydrogenothermus marinus TaxID=133270 RepID=A0A3M0BRZ9_9AQUI|nr:replication initiation protein [Hydrogenothermus marinus]RMB00058.1 plasmid replication initiation protein [Hydrogenothermus marinus]